MRVLLAVVLLVVRTTGAHASEGERLFNRVCAACHMTGGLGSPGTAPELREHVACLVQRPQGRLYVAAVLTHGLEGRISVEGADIEGYMPVITQLSSTEKAEVLTYVSSLSGRCPKPSEPFTASEVEAALNDPKWNPDTLHELRDQLMQTTSVPRTQNTPITEVYSLKDTDRAARDYTLFCRGCHAPAGEGVPGNVPALYGSVGNLVRTAAGRAFLARVPGVAFAPLDDVRLANLLNWVVESFGGAQLPNSFVPYSAAEVGLWRRQPFVDVDAARRQVLVDMTQ